MKQYLIKIKDGKKGLYGEIKMEKPHELDYRERRMISELEWAVNLNLWNEYEEHLRSLPFVAFAEALPNKEGDIVGENEFKIELMSPEEWMPTYNNPDDPPTIKVAIPLSNEKEETKGEDEKPIEVLKWMGKKPEFNRECTFVTATTYRRNSEPLEYDYNIWQIKKLDGETESGEPAWYWGLLNGDGEEWGDLDDLSANWYLILPEQTQSAPSVDAGNEIKLDESQAYDPNSKNIYKVEETKGEDELKIEYPSYEQCGGNKMWDEMSELEQANYKLCKALNAATVQRNHIKLLREKLKSVDAGKEVFSRKDMEGFAEFSSNYNKIYKDEEGFEWIHKRTGQYFTSSVLLDEYLKSLK